MTGFCGITVSVTFARLEVETSFTELHGLTLLNLSFRGIFYATELVAHGAVYGISTIGIHIGIFDTIRAILATVIDLLVGIYLALFSADASVADTRVTLSIETVSICVFFGLGSIGESRLTVLCWATELSKLFEFRGGTGNALVIDAFFTSTASTTTFGASGNKATLFTGAAALVTIATGYVYCRIVTGRGIVIRGLCIPFRCFSVDAASGIGCWCGGVLRLISTAYH